LEKLKLRLTGTPLPTTVEALSELILSEAEIIGLKPPFDNALCRSLGLVDEEGWEEPDPTTAKWDDDRSSGAV